MNKTLLIAFVMILTVAAVFSVGTTLVSAANNQTTYATVYVANSLPVVTDVTVNPSPANPSDTLTVTANVSDANGDLDVVWVKYYNTTGDLVANLGLVYNGGTGLYENTSFTLAANADPGQWNATVYANDSFGESSDYFLFSVNGLVAMELKNTPIDFGNASAGETGRRADDGTTGSGYDGGTIKGFPLKVNNTGNVNQNYTIKGLDLVGDVNPAYNIGVGNVSYNLTNTGGAGFSLTTSATQFASVISPAVIQDVYFWIDIPAVPQQDYTGNVTIRAVQSS